MSERNNRDFDRVIGAKMTVGHRTGTATVETIAETAQTQTAVATVAIPLHATTPATIVAVRRDQAGDRDSQDRSVVAIADENNDQDRGRGGFRNDRNDRSYRNNRDGDQGERRDRDGRSDYRGDRNPRNDRNDRGGVPR